MAEQSLSPMTPSSYERSLSEKDILSFQLEFPLLKMGDQSDPAKKSGSVPYDPGYLHIVAAAEFQSRFIQSEGSTDIVANALPPIDWRNPLFSEEDNRHDLKNKLYLPLSRALQRHGMTFSHDCKGVIPQGAADTSVVAMDDLETRVVFEGKSESFLQYLLSGIDTTFSNMCKTGRTSFLNGKPMRTNTARFSCPRILSQLLGYMAAKGTAYGVIITSGQAYFAWVVPEEEEPPTKKAKGVKMSSSFSQTAPGIYLTEAIAINHDNFLRIVFNFILQTKPTADPVNGVRASELLKTPSSGGGFTRGDPQEKRPTPKDRQTSAINPTVNRTTTTPRGAANSSLICSFPSIPPFKATAVLAGALGRGRDGRVVATEWHSLSAAVKIVRLVNNEREQRYARRVFESEVEAYEMAGRAGLWDLAVPRPLFVATDEKECVLCLTAGHQMPLDPGEWSDRELLQARESACLLFDAGIELTDIKPANFVLMDKVSCSQKDEQRVMAIDIEDSFLSGESESFELPEWMFRGSSRAQSVSP